MELIEIDDRPREMLWAEAVLPTEIGGWHVTRLRGETSGLAFVKKHKHSFNDTGRERYATRWFREKT